MQASQANLSVQQRLAIQLEEKRTANRALQHRVREYEEKEQEYAQTLMCVNRLWVQLNTDVVHLAAVATAGGDAAGSPTAAINGSAAGLSHHTGADASTNATTAASLSHIKDPFLQKLLLRSDITHTKPFLEKQKALDAETSELEDDLADRARGTKEALASLLDHIQQLRAARDALALQFTSPSKSSLTSGKAAASAAGAGGRDETMTEAVGSGVTTGATTAANGNTAAPSTISKSEMSRLVTEVAALRRQLHAAHASVRTYTEQARLADDRFLEEKQRNKRLENELADHEQELSNIRKKYVALRDSRDANGVGGGSGNGLDSALSIGGLAGGSGEHAITPGGGGSGNLFRQGSVLAGEDLADELSELRQALARRTAELDREKELHVKAQREIQEVLARVGDESWVPQTRMYASVTAQLASVTEHLTAKVAECEVLGRERDEAVREAHIRGQCHQSEQLARHKLMAHEKAYKELQFSKAESDRQRHELELTLARERERSGHIKTVPELKLMVATLQAEVQGLQQHAHLNKVARDKVDGAAREVGEACQRAVVKQLEAQRLQDKLKRLDSELLAGQARESALALRVGDLSAFVEVLITFCADPRSVAELRASEAVLRGQLEELKAAAEVSSSQEAVRKAEGAAAASKAQTELALVEADALRVHLSSVQRSEAELQSQLVAARAECELYITEIGTTGNAYEEMQAQNTRLLQQLTERDEANSQLLSERIKFTQQAGALTELLESARNDVERLSREAAETASLRDALEKDVVKLAAELTQAKDALRGQQMRVEALALEQKQREEAVVVAQAQMESAQRSAAVHSKAAEEAAEKAAREKTKRQRLEEEVKVLQAKVEKLRRSAAPSAGTEVRELEEELAAMRQLLNCNVCHERRKNVIITKCCHVFCDRCLNKNLQSRNRKCPGCQGAFAAGDVKQFFFT